MFKPKQHWLNELNDNKQQTQIYYEWIEILSGTTKEGKHLHVYRNQENGLLDFSLEE